MTLEEAQKLIGKKARYYYGKEFYTIEKVRDIEDCILCEFDNEMVLNVDVVVMEEEKDLEKKE